MSYSSAISSRNIRSAGIYNPILSFVGIHLSSTPEVSRLIAVEIQSLRNVWCLAFHGRNQNSGELNMPNNFKLSSILALVALTFASIATAQTV
jgi:hypothetical protein